MRSSERCLARSGCLCAALWAAVIASASLHSALACEPEGPRAPVLRFEQLGHGPLGSAYALTVFADGCVTYNGITNVKTVGHRSFRISAHEVRGLVEDLDALGFKDLRDEYRADAQWKDVIAARVIVSAQGWSKSVVFAAFGGGAEKYDEIVGTIERHAPTRDLRCPFVLPPPSRYRGTDVCTGKKVDG